MNPRQRKIIESITSLTRELFMGKRIDRATNDFFEVGDVFVGRVSGMEKIVVVGSLDEVRSTKDKPFPWPKEDELDKWERPTPYFPYNRDR